MAMSKFKHHCYFVQSFISIRRDSLVQTLDSLTGLVPCAGHNSVGFVYTITSVLASFFTEVPSRR